MPRSDQRRWHLGIGLTGDAGIEDAVALSDAVILRAGASLGDIVSLSTIESRRDHPLVLDFAARMGRTPLYYAASELETETPRVKNSSESLFRRIGCHAVAEAACLRAGGPRAQLAVEKTVRGGITMALAVENL